MNHGLKRGLLLAALTLTTAAHAWWGGPFNNDGYGNGYGNGGFSMNMQGSGNGYGNQYGRYGNPYGHGVPVPYGAQPG